MMKKKGILIFGAGGHGKVVLDILLESGVNVLGFIDEDKVKAGRIINGFKVLGGWDYVLGLASASVALGIGNNGIRQMIFKKAKDMRKEIVSAVHPSAVISKYARLKEGVVIMPQAVINSGTIIENGVIVNTAASVDHDCCLRQFCHIWPGARLAGAVKVGELSYVGTGASVIQNIIIGKDAIIGAGAVIISDVPNGATVVGNPGRVIKKNG